MMRFAGSFYPNSQEKLLEYFAHFNTMLDHSDFNKSLFEIQPKILIVPHAGYIYSGFTANIAYNLASRYNYEKVLIIGPSHHHYFQGISSLKAPWYQTPMGKLTLFSLDGVGFEPKAHNEHSTEVQMPFIKHYLPDTSVCEIVYGDVSTSALSPIIKHALEQKILVVISTDLSHFYTQQQANALDSHCLQAIKQLDLSLLDHCEACGIKGVTAALSVAKEYNFTSHLLDYRTSYDTSKDASRVVGYTSAIIS
jgi:AmmeMemoRadiSam system protein B